MSFNPLPSRMLITIHRPGLWVLSLSGVLLFLALLVWLAFIYGQKAAGYDKSEAMTYINELQQQLEESQLKYTESQHQAAMLERNSVIDGGASEQLKKSLSETQAELLELKKELSFYKSIVAPEDTKRSLAIQTIQVKPDLNGGYQYKITVSQRGRNDQFARGTIEVSVSGSREGKAAVLKLSEINSEIKKSVSFGFKYFQNFEGVMTLPVTFQPEYMRVQVKPRGSQIDPIDEQFTWSDLTAGGEQNVGQ